MSNYKCMKATIANLARLGAPAAKKRYKIGTHDGAFHCVEVLACAMLKLLPEYNNAQIVRTRNPELLAECDVVVDVGAVYDHKTKR